MKVQEEQANSVGANLTGEMLESKTLDPLIRDMWHCLITIEYSDGFLLREDSLKCAAYSRLRMSLDDTELTQKDFRVFPEYYFSSQRADLAVVKLKQDWERSGELLKNYVEAV